MTTLHRSSARRPSTARLRPGLDLPSTLWIKCPTCRALVYRKEFDDNLRVCPGCGHHLRLSAREWLAVLDVRDWQELDADLQPLDPLDFESQTDRYRDKLEQTQRQTGLNDAVISGRGALGPWSLVLAICDFHFIGASMGSVYGEKIARAAEHAAREHLPLVTINASVGARQQEGMLALLQMVKIPMALQTLAAAGQPHIALVVDHCYGGVSASYVGIADIIIAEPGTRIGFAGPRVIEQTIREQLPPDFQTAEFMLAHGMIDMIVARRELGYMLRRLLGVYLGARVPMAPDDGPAGHLAQIHTLQLQEIGV